MPSVEFASEICSVNIRQLDDLFCCQIVCSVSGRSVCQLLPSRLRRCSEVSSEVVCRKQNKSDETNCAMCLHDPNF